MVLVVTLEIQIYTCGVFEGDDILTTFRLTTKLQRTSDEYGVFIVSFFAHRALTKDKSKQS